MKDNMIIDRFSSDKPGKRRKSKLASIWRVLAFLGGLFLSGFLISMLVILLYQTQSNLNSPVHLTIIPGAGITIDGHPSAALRLRLDKGVEFYEEGLTEKIFISGNADEVRIMKNYLLSQAVGELDIIEDSDSGSTYDTVKNCRLYIESNHIETGTVFVSQKYHIPRIRLLVNRQDFPHPQLLATERKDVDLENYSLMLLRESMALYKAFIFDF